MARSDPATSAAAITPNDSTDLTVAARAIYVGTGGTLILKGWNDVSVTFVNVPDGTILPVAAKRVMATGTTASARAMRAVQKSAQTGLVVGRLPLPVNSSAWPMKRTNAVSATS